MYDERSDRLLRSKEVVSMVSYSRQHIHRLEMRGKFPRRLQVGPNRVAWRRSEVMAWIRALPLAKLPPVAPEPEPDPELE